MKIAWVSFDFPEYCVASVNALSTSHDVLFVFVSRESQSVKSEIHSAVKVMAPQRPRIRQAFKQIEMILAIKRAITEFQPDVIHVQHGQLWFNLFLFFFRRYPLVVTVHDPRQHEGDRESQKTPQWIMDRIVRRADRLIVHGKRLVKIVERDIGVSVEKIDVIPLIATGKRVEERREENPNIVLFFGRIWKYKGLEYLIKSEPLISEHCPQVEIVIAGTGEDFRRYRRMMKDPARFTVMNRFVSDSEREDLFRRAAVVVLPYVSASQSGVVPDAFRHRKPVVVTDVGALPEVVRDGVNGFIVPPRDHERLARAVIRLLGDQQLRIQMGEAGHAWLWRECAPDVLSRRTEEVYRRAIADRA